MSDLSLPLNPLPEPEAAAAGESQAIRELDHLRALACVDEVTGLCNRRHLMAQAEAAWHRARARGPALCLLAFVVPQVAHLAGTLGQAAANTLASALAARLVADAPAQAVLGHLGDGEFAALLLQPGGPDRPAALQLATRWQALLQEPVALVDLTVYPQCAIGLAFEPGEAQLGGAQTGDAVDAHALLVAAQSARREAEGKGAPACFRAESHALTLRALQVESALRQALDRNEMALLYQPQVCLVSGQILGAEALLRWTSAELGEVPAHEFIPVAERAGLMPAIGDWVIRSVCHQIAAWRAAALPALRLSVNISPAQFQLGDLAHTVRQALVVSGAAPASLALELTEAALQHGAERVRSVLKSLRASGVGISLDDFGTGASSLSSLRTLPIDLVKIHRSFITDLTAAPEAGSVTRSVIQLAHALGLPVLAEGVETEGQLHKLLQEGCDRIQGYLFSPPVSADEMAALLQQGRKLSLPAKTDTVRRTLLLVDDEPHILSALKRLFRRDGYQIHTAESGALALELLATTPVDVILSDQRMPGMAGTDFLRRAKVLHPDSIRMTLSGFTDLQSIIDAVNEGAVYKFLTKPWDDDRLRGHVAEAFAQKEMADENRRLQAVVAAGHAEQAQLNRSLAQLLEQRKVQTKLVQSGAATLRQMVDAMPLGVLGLDPEGLLAFVNPRATPWLAGLDSQPGQFAGAPLRALVEQLRASLAGDDGLPLLLNGEPLRAWLSPLDAAAEHRGDLVILMSTSPASRGEPACPLVLP